VKCPLPSIRWGAFCVLWLIAFLMNCQISKDQEPMVTFSNDTPGSLSISPSAPFNVTEGGATATFLLIPSRSPTQSVTISMGEPQGQIQFSPSVVTFDVQNWSTQTITITAVDDMVVESTQSVMGKIKVTKDDPSFLLIPDISVPVTVTDNDTPGIAIAATGLGNLVNEDALTDTVMISLSQAPPADVTVTFTNPAATRISLSPLSMTFTAQNWNTPVALLLSAYNDLIVQSPGRGIANYNLQAVTTSTATSYNSITVPFTVSVQDND